MIRRDGEENDGKREALRSCTSAKANASRVSSYFNGQNGADKVYFYLSSVSLNQLILSNITKENSSVFRDDAVQFIENLFDIICDRVYCESCSSTRENILQKDNVEDYASSYGLA